MIHFGKYSFANDSIDYVELQGDGSYMVHTSTRSADHPPIHITGEDADALREWLDRDRHRGDVEDELQEEHLKEHKKH